MFASYINYYSRHFFSLHPTQPNNNFVSKHTALEESDNACFTFKIGKKKGIQNAF